MQRPTLVFDFDGTVALGNGPVLAYAAEVAVAAGIGDRLVHELQHLLAAGTNRGSLDVYDLVRTLAVDLGADQAALDEGYRRSRDLFATPTAPVVAPIGLADFLADTVAERILVTNAPFKRLPEALESLGLVDAFDRVVTSAGKPAGLERLLDELLDDGRRDILCIGDIWRNDLAPAHERGLPTAIVGGWSAGGEPATYRAADVVELLPTLRAWVAEAAVRADTGRTVAP